VVERDHLIWIWMAMARRRSGKNPRFSVLARSGLARASRLSALRRELPADRRQSFRLRASRLRAREDAGGSEEYAFKSKPTAIERLDDGFRVERLAHERAAAAVPQEGRARPGRGRPAQHRPDACPGIFFMETLFSQAGSGAEKASSEGAKQYRNCQSSRGDVTQHAFLLDYLHDYDLQDRMSRSPSITAWWTASWRTRRSSRRSSRRSRPIRRSRMNAIVSDAPLVHFRRTLARMIAEERAD